MDGGIAPAAGHWGPADAFAVLMDHQTRRVQDQAFPPERLSVSGRPVEVRGFIERGSAEGGQATVLLLSPAHEGFCVLSSWQTPVGTPFARLSLVSAWQSRDGHQALVLLEATGDRTSVAASASPPAFLSVVFATDGTRVRRVLERDVGGLAFDPQPGTPVLLGAGEPLYLDDMGLFRPRPGAQSATTVSVVCPKTRNARLDITNPESQGPDLRLDTWLPGDEVGRLYERWGRDDRARVAFRHLVRRGVDEVEVVGIQGDAASIVFLSRAPKGFCVRNAWYEPWGGNGVALGRPSWWPSPDGRRVVLLVGLALNFHHGVDPDDPREEAGEVALTLDGVIVRDATTQERELARAGQRP